MKRFMKQLERLLEWGSIRKDVVCLVVSCSLARFWRS